MRWSLDDLDFPVLVLRDPPVPPALTGLGGGDLHGLISVGIGYGRTRSGAPGLTLETLVRRGHRLTPQGGASWVGTSLPDLAAHAVRTLLLAEVSGQQAPPRPEPGPEPGPAERVERVEELEARARALGDAAPADPWRVVEAEVDGTRFALWLSELDEGFAAVLDCGPVILTASGTTPPRDWRLVALSPDAVRAVLGAQLRAATSTGAGPE